MTSGIKPIGTEKDAGLFQIMLDIPEGIYLTSNEFLLLFSDTFVTLRAKLTEFIASYGYTSYG